MTTINFGTIKQASEPTVTFTWPLPSSHAPTNWTGAAITGTMKHIRTEAVTAITGALVVVTGATRECTWAMSPEDTGTAGVAAADVYPRVTRLTDGQVMWAECEGGDVPLMVLDGPGQSVGLWCKK